MAACERCEKISSPVAHVQAVARSTLYAWLFTRSVGVRHVLEHDGVGVLARRIKAEVLSIVEVGG